MDVLRAFCWLQGCMCSCFHVPGPNTLTGEAPRGSAAPSDWKANMREEENLLSPGMDYVCSQWGITKQPCAGHVGAARHQLHVMPSI